MESEIVILSCTDSVADVLRKHVADSSVWKLLSDDSYRFAAGTQANILTLCKKNGHEITETQIFMLGFDAARSI